MCKGRNAAFFAYANVFSHCALSNHKYLIKIMPMCIRKMFFAFVRSVKTIFFGFTVMVKGHTLSRLAYFILISTGCFTDGIMFCRLSGESRNG